MNSFTQGTATDIQRDQRGRALFVCRHCGGELTSDDVVAQGLRLPDLGETSGEYCEAELVDDLGHLACARAQRAS